MIQKYGFQLYLTGHHHAYYPGFYQGVHFVSQACLGAGAEKLPAMTTPSARSITMIDFFEDHFQVSALRAPDYTEKINHEHLPQNISAKNHVLTLKDYSERLRE